jgi:peroxiredoxin
MATDIGWCFPLGLVLWCAFKLHARAQRHAAPEIQRLALRTRTNKGRTLLEMSREKPLLIVFLRTTDCPFCRESLTQIIAVRRGLERKDVQLVLVHMEEDQAIHDFLHAFQLSDVPRVSDPHLHLYRAFGLRRGPVWNVLGPSVWVRGLATLVQYGAGKLTPDLLQMPGVFVVFHGQVLWNFVHQSIADQPRYEDIPWPM